MAETELTGDPDGHSLNWGHDLSILIEQKISVRRNHETNLGNLFCLFLFGIWGDGRILDVLFREATQATTTACEED